LKALVAALALAALAACAPREAPPPVAPPPAKLVLAPASFVDLPGWADDRHAEFLPAFARSCARLARVPDGRETGLGARAADWRRPCAQAAAIAAGDNAAAKRFLETAFRPFLASDEAGGPDGLFTGYYEPELRGSAMRGGNFTIPLRARPNDLVTVDLGEFRPELRGQRIAGSVENGALRPYPTRAGINQGAIDNRTNVLVWVDDPVDAFFLEIQGSGRVVMPDGRVTRLGFAAQNGQPYVAIGRTLIERGALTRETVSMQSIRAWLAANPAQARAVMETNPSYVFFRVVEGDGPLGSEGVALTPGRSLAVDRAHLAMGLPLWLDAADPLEPTQRIRRAMMAQDTGGAIRGAVRGDVFWGAGTDAAERAGKMRSPGRYWIFLPVEIAERRLRGS
jgi:membrane-bound lytic murein transglycosylase A